MRHAGAHHAAAVASRGRRRRGRLHRARRRLDRGRRCPRCSTTRPGDRPWPMPRSPGPMSSPGRPAREAHLASYARAAAAGLSPRVTLEAVVLVGGQGHPAAAAHASIPPNRCCRWPGCRSSAHQLARARAAGVEHIVLATSYRPEVFEEYFGDGADLGLRIDYVTEVEPLGTGGGIRNVADRLEVRPGRSRAHPQRRHPLRPRHRRPARPAPTPRRRRDPAPRRGRGPAGLRLRADRLARRVTGFIEKSPDPVTNRINAGCYVFTRRVDRRDSGRPAGLGGAGDVPRPARRRRGRARLPRLVVLAGRRHAGRLRAGQRRRRPRRA